MISKWPDFGENASATLYVATQKAQGARSVFLFTSVHDIWDYTLSLRTDYLMN